MLVATTLPNDVEELKRQLVHKTAQVEALKSEVLRLRRWRYGRSSEAIDSSRVPELPLAGGELASAPASTPTHDLAKVPKLVSVEPREPRTQRRPPRALPAELPRVVEVHAPPHCACPECGGALRPLGEDVSEQLDYVPGYFQVIRQVRPKLSCGRCALVVQEAAPARPIERALPTAGLLAQVIGAKYADHCPLYRQEGMYRRVGVELPRSLLAAWVSETAQLVDPLVSALERYVLAAAKLHADDTPVPVLSPGLGRTRTGRLWGIRAR